MWLIPQAHYPYNGRIAHMRQRQFDGKPFARTAFTHMLGVTGAEWGNTYSVHCSCRCNCNGNQYQMPSHAKLPIDTENLETVTNNSPAMANSRTFFLWVPFNGICWELLLGAMLFERVNGHTLQSPLTRPETIFSRNPNCSPCAVCIFFGFRSSISRTPATMPLLCSTTMYRAEKYIYLYIWVYAYERSAFFLLLCQNANVRYTHVCIVGRCIFRVYAVCAVCVYVAILLCPERRVWCETREWRQAAAATPTTTSNTQITGNSTNNANQRATANHYAACVCFIFSSSLARTLACLSQKPAEREPCVCVYSIPLSECVAANAVKWDSKWVHWNA